MKTVIEGTYSKANAHMPPYHENLWSDPRVIEIFGPGVVEGRTTVCNVVFPEVSPGDHIQVREVLPKAA